MIAVLKAALRVGPGNLWVLKSAIEHSTFCAADHELNIYDKVRDTCDAAAMT